MSTAQPAPQSLGVIWRLALPDQPAAPASRLPARFGRVGPQSQAELAQAMGLDDPAPVRRRF